MYKKHKEEFYDSTSKQWMVTHYSTKKCFDSSLDAEDDEIISCAISSTDNMEMVGSLVIVLQFINSQNLYPYLRINVRSLPPTLGQGGRFDNLQELWPHYWGNTHLSNPLLPVVF